jgi:hypothetical protein
MNDIFDRTNKTLARKLAKNEFGEFERNRNTLLKAVGTDLAKLVGPALIEAARTILGKQTIQVEAPKVTIPAPIVNVQSPPVPQVHVPAPIANVTVPPIKIPDINIPRLQWPEGEMPIRGKVTLDGVNEGSPLSVQIRDSKGRPVDFNLGSNIITGGGGGIAKQVKINNTSDNPVPITGSLTVAAATSTYVIPGNRDGVIYNGDNPLPVTITSGASATSAVNVVDSSGVAYSGSNPIPVAITSGGTATTAVQNLDGDGNYRGTFPVEGTVAVSDVTASLKSALIDSSGVQYSGSNPVPVGGTVSVSGVSGSINATIVDSAGNYRDTFPIQGTVAVSDVTASVKSALIDSSGEQYSGSNPVPMTLATSNPTSTVNAVLVDSAGAYRGTIPAAIVAGSAAIGSVTVNGSTNSLISVGPTLHDAVDVGSAPQKVGGVAVQANPTAVAGGDVVNFRGDDLGRQLIRPIQVRDLTATAYVALSNGTETTLFTGATSTYHDLIYVLASNNSTAAVGVDIRATLAGNIMMHLEVPANGVVGVATPVPIPAGDVGASWTADLPDITGTTVYLSALFSKEI